MHRINLDKKVKMFKDGLISIYKLQEYIKDYCSYASLPYRKTSCYNGCHLMNYCKQFSDLKTNYWSILEN